MPDYSDTTDIYRCSKGFIRTNRILPFKPSLRDVPPHVLRKLTIYLEQGDELHKQNRTKCLNIRGILRRYHLIPPPCRIKWCEMDDAARHNHIRAYNREWYKRRKAP